VASRKRRFRLDVMPVLGPPATVKCKLYQVLLTLMIGWRDASREERT
jgi:hypothetical protein